MNEREHHASRHRPGTHLRDDHRQDHVDRAGAAGAARLVSRPPLRRAVRGAAARLAHLSRLHRHRDLGQQPAGRLGVRHHELCLVDRHRPRRHVDLRDPAAVQAEVAHLDQQVRRGDDAVRGALRRYFSVVSHRTTVARLLDAALPEHDERLAAVQEPAHLGRVRGLDLRVGVAALLVRRAASRSGDAPRPGDVARRAHDLRHPGDGLARIGAPLASLRDLVPAARRRWPRRSSSRFTPW